MPKLSNSFRRRLAEKREIEEKTQEQVQPPPTKEELQEYIRQNEHVGTTGIIHDIQDRRVKKGDAEIKVGGRPIDWHDLEDFVLAVSPYKFVNILKLKEDATRADVMRWRRDKEPKVNTRILIWIIVAIGVMILGVILLMFMPQIIAMFSGGQV